MKHEITLTLTASKPGSEPESVDLGTIVSIAESQPLAYQATDLIEAWTTLLDRDEHDIINGSSNNTEKQRAIALRTEGYVFELDEPTDNTWFDLASSFDWHGAHWDFSNYFEDALLYKDGSVYCFHNGAFDDVKHHIKLALESAEDWDDEAQEPKQTALKQELTQRWIVK